MQDHWENVYATKAPEQVSWFRPHLETSLALIEHATRGDRTAAIIDVGAGPSTLVDDLVADGYRDITILDISQKAIGVAKERLGDAGRAVQWVCADVTGKLPSRTFDVWHDRAVFHFLTQREDREAYIHNVGRAVTPGGHVIVSTFGPEGPEKCSGLEVMRYDADLLHDAFGPRFRLVESAKELHRTPFGSIQQFVYCHCTLEQ